MNNETQTKTEPNPNQEPEVGAAWERVGRNGKKYLSLTINGKDGIKHNFVGFLNTFKQNEKQPDYRVFKRKESTGSNTVVVKDSVDI